MGMWTMKIGKSVAMLALAAAMIQAGSASSEENKASGQVPDSFPNMSSAWAPQGGPGYGGPGGGGGHPMGPYGNQGWNGPMGYPGHMGNPNPMGGFGPPRGQSQQGCACARMMHGGGHGPMAGTMGQAPAMVQPPAEGVQAAQPSATDAQAPAPTSAPAPGMPQTGEFLVAQHLESLKRQIGLTEAQNAPWQVYADALKDQMAVHGEKHQQMMAMATMNSLQRAEARLQIMEKAIERRRVTVAAYNALFNALSDEQKVQADRVLSSLPMMGGL